MIKSILLSVDGSVYTDPQVKHCIRLAKAFEAKVHVLTIVDIRFVEWASVMSTDGFVPVIPSTGYRDESKKLLEAKADAVLKKCAAFLKKENIKFDARKINGPPADIICDQSHLVDLLLIGARGEFAKWGSKLIGSTLDAVLRQFNKPIFITPQKFEELSKLLIAYDGSDKANKGLQLAAFIAKKLQIALTILSVGDNQQIQNRYLNEAQTYLEPYEIATEMIGSSGSPEKEILRVAKDNHCNLIIMGSFGHSRIREAILGSTTEHVMRNSTIPILLCK